MGFHSLVNTAQFSEAANDWKKNKGIYTRAPEGSREYREYWQLQEDRCANGFTCGDLWIPGRHYFYLNFTPILKVPDATLIPMLKESVDKRGQMSGLVSDRILEFPRFWEVDYEWYNFKHIAWHGGEFMGVSSPGAQHIACAKSRGAGFSYKEASDGVYNYTFIPKSKSYYFAGLEQYLNIDGIMNKVDGMLDWVNEYCPEWFQNRMKSGTVLHQVASYVDDRGQVRGNKSEIIGITVNDPDKTRGKRGRKIVFEEAGSFKNLKKALKVAIGAIKAGAITVGQISLFGTGGEEGLDIEGLEEIFSDPVTYNMLAFPNVWEEGMESTLCGYYVPCWRVNDLFIDEQGNCEIEGALTYELGERKKLEGAKDFKLLDMHQAEYNINPSEVFKRTVTNPFRSNAIKAHIQYVEKSAYIQGLIRYGYFEDHPLEGLIFKIQTKAKAQPVIKYPHEKGDNLEGCITVFESPYRDVDGNVPTGLYQVVFDPYYKEESKDVTSLFAVYVLKLYNDISPQNEGLPVANYVGRPEDLDTAYEAVFNLCRYYNCTAQGEISGGGMGVFDYATNHKLLHLLDFEPEMLHTKEISGNKKNRTYLMDIPTEKKRMGMTYLVDWHKQPRGVNEKGNKILNLHGIYDVGLLKEWQKYAEGKNADRTSALLIGMFMLKERAYKAIIQKKEQNKDSFYKRRLYAANVESSQIISSY